MVTLSIVETSGAPASCMLKLYINSYYEGLTYDAKMPIILEQYQCPHCHIFLIGRANAGKITILEKVWCCKGDKPHHI
jgi:hypothetical protein